jgi:hypothetical protein
MIVDGQLPAMKKSLTIGDGGYLMKRFIIALLMITISLAAGFLYVRIHEKHSLGPSSILLFSILGCLSLLLSATLLLYRTRARKKIARIWLVVISLSVTYATVELVSSYFLIQRLSPPNIADQYRHHKLLPSTRSEFKSRGEYSYIQTVNNLGLRGHDIPLDKSPDHYRILMLGDSFTMGKGVRDDQTFSVLLEEALNAKNITVDRKPIEVLNAGVDSYAPILSFFQLTRDLRPLEPNLVVLNLDMSDLVQETAYRKLAVHGSKGEILGIPGPDRDSLSIKVRGWIDRNLYVTRLILFYVQRSAAEETEATVENVVTQANPELLKHTLADDTVDRKEQWQNIFDSILKIKEYCDGKGIQFLLTTYPWGHQVNDKEWVPGRSRFIPSNAVASDKSIQTIQQFSIDNHVQFLNTFAAFRAYNGSPPLYFSYDMHWTDAGHKIMAQELERCIRAIYLNGGEGTS